MEIREIVARELSCILLPSFPGSAQLSVACSTEKILDTRCVFLSLLAVRYNQLHLCYHLQKSSATSCISVITSRSPVQPAASLLSPPEVQCNQLHLCYHFQMSSATSCISPITSMSKTHRHDEVLINLGLIRNIFTNMLRDSSKTENYCRSRPVKFDEKLKIDNPIRKHP